MRRSDFNYSLPEELIAQAPLPDRASSRLLRLASQDQYAVDTKFKNIVDILQPGDLLIMNNTRVIPARLYGTKATGGKVEILLERLLTQTTCLAQIRASKSPKSGTHIHLDNDSRLTVISRQDDLFKLEYMPKPGEPMDMLSLLEAAGHMPLPPYIQRPDNDEDARRYQTVYAEQPGAVAAPTAGLHFDEPTLDELKQKGVLIEKLTLHVGAGTFQPVRVDDVEDHHMHEEWFSVNDQVVEAVLKAKASGHRVVAVGTTSLRALEAAAQGGQLEPMQGLTDIFIYPGYQFRVVDALITNFHLPESTLLMLVCALGGYDRVLSAYAHAVEQNYRFFSYGDAMWLEPLAGNSH